MRLESYVLIGALAFYAITCATARADELARECGQGPHEIQWKTVSDATCEMKPARDPVDGSYGATYYCPAVARVSFESQWWSDWPECEGAYRLRGDPANPWCAGRWGAPRATEALSCVDPCTGAFLCGSLG